MGVLAATIVELDAATIGRILSVFIPLAVGLTTKKLASGPTKALVLAGFAAVTGVLTEALGTGGKFVLEDAVNGVIDSIVIAAGMYYGLLKPTGIAEKVQDLKPHTGIGSEVSAVPPVSTKTEVSEPLGAPPPSKTKKKAKRKS